jgi:hypothetical protein
MCNLISNGQQTIFGQVARFHRVRSYIENCHRIIADKLNPKPAKLQGNIARARADYEAAKLAPR